MPRGPKGEKRPADVIGAAVMVGRIATGEIEDRPATPESEGKNPAAEPYGPRGRRRAAAPRDGPKRTQSLTAGLAFPTN
jgi:hypothetical protein